MLKPLGLYLHIPFCVQKCKYCDFTSFVKSENDIDEYVKILEKELDFVKNYTEDYYLDSVFFGGGTPSILSEENMEFLMNKIKRSFYINDNCEFSFEANPKTVQLKKLKAYKSFGFNRISIGVQSLDDELLNKIGRVHNVKDFLECYSAAKLAGFENINYDIMFALPEQSFKKLEETVDNILKFDPDSISAYSLILEEGTPLYYEKHNYPDDDENRRMYYMIRDKLKEKGLNQYEISNFAKIGKECRHNIKYWELAPYIGVGVCASSFFENARSTNPKNLDEYKAYVEGKKPLFLTEEKQSTEDLMGEFMFLGLRKTKGISDVDFQKLFNISFFEKYKDVIEKHKENGLIEIENDRIFLTEKGMDLSNFVMSDFV